MRATRYDPCAVDPWDLVDQLVDVALSSDPATAGDRVLRAALAFTGGTRAALFQRQQETLKLYASRGVDQAALDQTVKAWESHREAFMQGRSRLEDGAALSPVMDRGELLGLLFVEVGRPHDARDLEALSRIARIAAQALAKAKADPTGYLATTTPNDVARDQLLVLLEQNEWNISRVARALGVTRPTIYARLDKYGIERRRHHAFRKRQSA